MFLIEDQFQKHNKPAHITMTNLTGTIFKGSCLVYAIVVNADGADAQVDIYDGMNTSGEHKFRINTLSNTDRPIMLTVPTDFDYGIHIVVNAATTFVSVQYVPVNRGYPL